jgi:glycosyltransferase involved in cell wall biosynthesis
VRILTVGNMYPPHHLGGYELTWRSAVEHLRGRGHEVRVVTTDYRRPDPDPAISDDADVHRRLRWYWHEHEFPRMSLRERARLERHNAQTLDAETDEFRPDVVSWWAMGGMSLGLIERLRRQGVPAVGVVGDDWMVYGRLVDGWQRAFGSPRPLAWMVERITGLPTRMRLSDVTWLFNSGATLQRGVKAGHLQYAEIAHPGVDASLFRPAPAREWRWRLLCVGRLDERKGMDTAVATLNELPPEATLTVLGAGDEQVLSRLRGEASALGVEHRVRFGSVPRDELPAAYSAADVLLFPVRWEEPWGLVPLEAMAVGRPVVASGTGGSAEYLRHEQNALVVGRDRGPLAFAAAVRRLAGDSGLRARLTSAGHATASQLTEQAYNEAIERALARAARS